jgi:hypothetical protein
MVVENCVLLRHYAYFPFLEASGLLNQVKDPPLFKNLISPKMTYPNLTVCSSGPEARICIFLVPFQRKHFEVCGKECRRITQ